MSKDFPGGSVVKTLYFSAGDAGSISGQGAKIPHALGPKNENRKQKQWSKLKNKQTTTKKPNLKKHIDKTSKWGCEPRSYQLWSLQHFDIWPSYTAHLFYSHKLRLLPSGPNVF